MSRPAARDNFADMDITRRHTQRLRQMYRSAGWPVLDVLEAELLAAGLLERERGAFGCETLRVTDAGIAAISQSAAGHRAGWRCACRFRTRRLKKKSRQRLPIQRKQLS